MSTRDIWATPGGTPSIVISTLVCSVSVPGRQTTGPSSIVPGPGDEPPTGEPAQPTEGPAVVLPDADTFQIALPTSNVAVHASSTSGLNLGDALVLTCCVDQQAYPILDWYYLNGNLEEMPLPDDAVISDKGQLVILRLEARHAGIYQCIHRGVAGAESGEAVVVVRGSSVTTASTTNQCSGL